jgi:hypothetical protein
MNADEDRQWDAIVRCWGNAYSFSHDPGGHPGEPYAARRSDWQRTLRAATPAALLDAIKDDAVSAPPAGPGRPPRTPATGPAATGPAATGPAATGPAATGDPR